ncbi:hypothetical protein GH733_013155 [Mirounga leonina]|nr:hypothetical protein GH733_013155 [Mirounga leonina]
MSGASKEGLETQGLPVSGKACLTTMDKKLNVLNEKVDKLLHFQEDVSEKLQCVYQGMGHLEQGLHRLEAYQILGPGGADHASPAHSQAGWPEVLELVRAVRQDAAQHGAKLEALFRMVVAVDKAIALVGTVFQNSKVVDFIMQGSVPWRKGSLADGPLEAEAPPGQEEGIPGPAQVPPGLLPLPTEAEAKAPGSFVEKPGTGQELSAASTGVREAPTSQEALPGTEQGSSFSRPDPQPSGAGMRLTPGLPVQAKAAHSGGETPPRISIHVQETDTPGELLVTRGGGLRPTPPVEAPAAAHPGEQDPPGPVPQTPTTKSEKQIPKGAGKVSPLRKRSSHEEAKAEEKQGPGAESATGPSGARRDKGADAGGPGWRQDKGEGAGNAEPGENLTAGGAGRDGAGRRTPPGEEPGSVVLDDSPAPPAPFEHRVVSVKETSTSAGYTVCQHDVLGGGRFGQVHRCTEKSTGLSLAAKIIKVKSAKDREDVKNEVNIMNQLSHVNLIQLYDAFESKNSFTLVMEYVDGGELFDRITEEKYQLTELAVILFTKQICQAVHYLHQHYILHLDLKPENILCVNQTGHQIKIIDFGLARRYKPREKLKVNFGTPEFLAPEVVNYEFVSFPTDILSGLSPFLGETDAETMNFIVNCSWDFDADTFEGLSEEAKDFVSRLLVKEKRYRTFIARHSQTILMGTTHLGAVIIRLVLGVLWTNSVQAEPSSGQPEKATLTDSFNFSFLSCRMSATQCLKHEWLNNLPAKASKSKVRLKSQLLLQKYMAQRKWKVSVFS